MNLCHPDGSRSCAACCGLYNVKNASKTALSDKLEYHTLLFRTVERSAEAIWDYKSRIAIRENNSPLDPEIHVCEFIGFPDPSQLLVGCMLHPAAQGNDNIDLRGMCHYGSMACKSFFCPAWNEIPALYCDVLLALVDDWHLYGLVVTDVDFVMSLFGLIEHRLGNPLNPKTLTEGPAREVLRELISWKDVWPFGRNSTFRRSRYYFKSSFHKLQPDFDANLARFLETLNFTFDIEANSRDAADLVVGTLDRLVRTHDANERRTS